MTLNNQDGLSIDGTIGTADIDTISFLSAAGAASYVGIEFTANAQLDFLRCKNNNFVLNNAADFGLSLDAAANLGNNLPGFFDSNNLQGAGSPFSGFDQTDIRTRFSQNGGFPDSDLLGNAYFIDNTTETVISVAGTFVPVGTGATSPPHEAFVLDPLSERFSLTGAFPNQALQYDGLRSEPVLFTYNIVLQKVGGGTPDLSARLTLNGVPVAKTSRTVSVGGAESSVSITTVISVSTGDTLQLEVANQSGTANIVVSAANLVASKIGV